MKLSNLYINARLRLLLLIGVWTLVMVVLELLTTLDGLAWIRWLVWLWVAVGVMIMIAVIIDLIYLAQACNIIENTIITRDLPNNLPVHEKTLVHLSFYGTKVEGFMATFRCRVIDNTPPNVEINTPPLVFLLGEMTKDQGELTMSYELYAHKRGHGIFEGVDWEITTPIGLLIKHHYTPKNNIKGNAQVRVMANFKAVLQGHLMLLGRHGRLMGNLKKHLKGQGQDFHQIRAYLDGDGIRQIDWKATSRHQKLMAREYQDETNQEILFLLDCGQHMRHLQFDDDTAVMQGKRERIGHLDMALNAMLLLAQVANEQGDATGFISFGATQDKVCPPKKGSHIISHLLNQSFDLTASMSSPDYMAAATQALTIQKRHSIIIIITNIHTTNNDELVHAIRLLTKKHRVIVANLSEEDLHAKLFDDLHDTDDALTYHGIFAHLHTQWQQNTLLHSKTHATVIGCKPAELPHKLINTYWTIKRWGMA